MKISNGQRTKENWEAGKAWYSFILPAEKNINKIDFIANIYPTVRKIYIICTFVIFTDFFFFQASMAGSERSVADDIRGQIFTTMGVYEVWKVSTFCIQILFSSPLLSM